jgi:hypothetical protein
MAAIRKAKIAWRPCFRIVPSRFPPVALFDQVADPQDLEAVYQIEAMTNARLRDEVDIAAGHMTPIVWAFAQVFYRHRQHRWRALARTLLARRLINHEMADFEKAYALGDTGLAWQALERAHIILQITGQCWDTHLSSMIGVK